MDINNYSLEEQNILKECLSNIHNINLLEKAYLLNDPDNYIINNDSTTSKKIDIIKKDLHQHPKLEHDILEYEFNSLIKNIDLCNEKSIPSSLLNVFQKKRQEEILHQANKELSTWYDKMGDKWVNDRISLEQVNTWGVKVGLEKITKNILKNNYILDGTCIILNSSIGKGNRELFDLAIKAKSSINGSEACDKAFNTPLAYYPRTSTKRSRNENEALYEYMLDTLISNGADINKFHNSKSSYVHLSATSGNYHQLTKLLENGAKANNVWIQDDKQFSTIQMLQQNKKDDLVQLINTYIELQKPKQFTINI